MKRCVALLLCLGMIAGLLSGCAAEEEPYIPTGSALVMEGEDPYANDDAGDGADQDLSLAYYADRSMNPLVSSDFTNRALFSLIYQGLFSVNPNYEATPILCKSFQASSDNRTYTFYLENACFSDGSFLTVEDVLATYMAAKESDYYSGRFTHITDISASEDGGITFRLNTPYENLPLLLDIPILKAEEIEADTPLGTGPYALAAGLSGAYLWRVTNWWCGKVDMEVTASSIPLIAAESPSHIRDEFEFSDVGLVCADPCTYNYADFRCDFELWDCDNGYFLYLVCNLNYSYDDIFEDTRLRSKLTYAIDRNALVENIYRGFARPATLPADPNCPFYSDSLAKKYEYDPMKFIDVLGDYLITEPIRLLVNSDDRMRLQTARSIAQMLTDHGMITVTVEKSTTAYLQAIVNGDYDMYLGRTKLSANMDLSCFFGPWANISYNGISDAAIYNRCLDALANEGNYYNLHQMVADDGRIVPLLFYGYAVYGTRGLLSDLTPSRDNVFYYSLGKTLEGIQIPTDYGD